MAYKAALNRSDEEAKILSSLLLSDLTIEERDLAIHQSIARGSGNILYIFLLNFLMISSVSLVDFIFLLKKT
jgi:DNA-binding FadR family transcriptional regulator